MSRVESLKLQQRQAFLAKPIFNSASITFVVKPMVKAEPTVWKQNGIHSIWPGVETVSKQHLRMLNKYLRRAFLFTYRDKKGSTRRVAFKLLGSICSSSVTYIFFFFWLGGGEGDKRTHKITGNGVYPTAHAMG